MLQRNVAMYITPVVVRVGETVVVLAFAVVQNSCLYRLCTSCEQPAACIIVSACCITVFIRVVKLT